MVGQGRLSWEVDGVSVRGRLKGEKVGRQDFGSGNLLVLRETVCGNRVRIQSTLSLLWKKIRCFSGCKFLHRDTMGNIWYTLGVKAFGSNKDFSKRIIQIIGGKQNGNEKPCIKIARDNSRVA